MKNNDSKNSGQAVADVRASTTTRDDVILGARLIEIYQGARDRGLLVIKGFVESAESAIAGSAPVFRRAMDCSSPHAASPETKAKGHSDDDLDLTRFELLSGLEANKIGIRTSASLRHIARQGYYPSAGTPFGFGRAEILDRGKRRWKLVPNPEEAEIVRELFRLYVSGLGARSVANQLNGRAILRRGRRWSKKKVLRVIGETAVVGTYFFGKHKTRSSRPVDAKDEVPIAVEPILDHELFDAAQRIRVGSRRTRLQKSIGDPE